MNEPAISVCIPTYNAAPWIAATIDSVLAQTRGDFELVILDDCSADDTLGIVRRYDDPRIRLLVHERNMGAEAAWNRLLQEARGRFVKLLCCDDLIYPTCLERQAAILERPDQATVALVTGPRDIIDDAGAVIVRRRGMTQAGRVEGQTMIRRVVASGRNWIGEPLSVMFRREVAASVGGFDASEPYCIDIDLWCRLLSKGDLWVVPETVGAFRVSRSSWSFRLAGKQSAQDRAFFARIRDQFAPTMPRWQLWLGQARCTRDAFLRQVIYWWLGRKAGTAESDRSRRGILHRLGRMRWTHYAAHWLGAYALANSLLQAFPRRRTLPRSGCSVRVRSVAGLALAEEMLAGQAYSVLKKFGAVQTFIDLGSNTGWFPCLLREYGCSPSPRGLLIDADPAMVEESRWHMAENGIDAECLWGAVGVAAGSGDGTTRFHVNPANTSSSLKPFGADHPFPVKGRVLTISVPTIQIADAWRQRHGDRPVDVLKVDVEGAEFDLFRLEADFVATKVRAVVCEWHAWHGSLDDLTAIVEPLGFRLLEVGQQDAHGGVAAFVSSRAPK